jgi:hypothetical protein
MIPARKGKTSETGSVLHAIQKGVKPTVGSFLADQKQQSQQVWPLHCYNLETAEPSLQGQIKALIKLKKSKTANEKIFLLPTLCV